MILKEEKNDILELEDESLESLPLCCANCFWIIEGETSYEKCSGQCETQIKNGILRTTKQCPKL